MFYSDFSELLLLNTIKTQNKKYENKTIRKLQIINFGNSIYFKKLEDTVLANRLLKDYIDNMKIIGNKDKTIRKYTIKNIKNQKFKIQLFYYSKKMYIINNCCNFKKIIDILYNQIIHENNNIYKIIHGEKLMNHIFITYSSLNILLKSYFIDKLINSLYFNNNILFNLYVFESDQTIQNQKLMQFFFRKPNPRYGILPTKEKYEQLADIMFVEKYRW